MSTRVRRRSPVRRSRDSTQTSEGSTAMVAGHRCRIGAFSALRPVGRRMAAYRGRAATVQAEVGILHAVFDDHKQSTIAVNLGVSTHTAHTHLERLYRKLSVSSRVALVARLVGVCCRLGHLVRTPRDPIIRRTCD